MNSFEQIKALLELKEKGAISDAEFKKMLDILEAESKKEENAGVRSENLEESDDAEELGVRQKETEQKIRTQAEQTTREIRELVQLGKIEEALITFSNFERKDLFDPKMSQLLNEKKAELEKKKAEEARFDREREERFNKQEQLKKLRQKRQVYSFVIGLALILAFTGYCSNKKSPSNDNESLDTKETTYIENADTLAKSEDDAALKQKFLSHQYITTKDARLRKTFGIVFLQFTDQGEYRRASTVLGLDKPDALIKGPKLIQLLNERFGLNVAIPVSENQEVNPKPEIKPEPKPKPEQKPNPKPKPEQRQPQQPQSQPRQEQYTSSELLEFPEKYLFEAERLKQKIKDPAVSLEEKNLAADHIITIRKEYESNVNKKWKENPQVQRILTDCIKVALKY
jgi:hypothetical protein